MMSAVLPVIEINGSVSDSYGSSSNNFQASIATDWSQLIAPGGNVFQASGARVFDMDAGTLASASQAQVGRVVNGVKTTQAMVDQNLLLLKAIGTYCTNNGISIHVEAMLTSTKANDWTQQWLQPAVLAGLPITAVESDDEISSSVADTPANYAALANNEVAIVAQITKAYPSVKIGDWQGGAASAAITDWWTAYDKAADAAQLPRISYVVADTSWNAPWVTSTSAWQAWLVNLSQLVQKNHMEVTVLMDGGQGGTNALWTSQAEQHAAMLATLSGVTVNTLLIRSWNIAHPDSVFPINEPTTIGNAAAEIAAIYPLYSNGTITATNAISISVTPQMVVTMNTKAAAVGPISLTWSAADLAAGSRIAVVITDQTGSLSALQSGMGKVSGGGTNQLTLSGTYADIDAELRSLEVTESVAGLDSIDIEVFGINGRLGDSQISLLSLAAAPTGKAQAVQFGSTQFWTSASATLNAANVITNIGYTWNSPTALPVAGVYKIIKTISIHEPLAEGGVIIVNGAPREPLANPIAGSAASLPLNLSYWNNSAYNPSSHLSAIGVLSTSKTYGAISGKLQSVTDTLVASNPVSQIIGSNLANYFVTGGTQTTQFNTGDNPNWQSSWSAGLTSVTTTYGSNNQILEQLYQGGASEPWFVLDNVFDPYTGQLWEQFQTIRPPAPFNNFVTGDQLLTLFNTGDNPNWDYTDWGKATQVTILWEDYYAKAMTSIPTVRTGLINDASSSLSQLTLNGPNGGGGILIGCNGSTTINAIGRDTIYAGLGTTTIATGKGGSTIYLSDNASSAVTIVSGGGDTVWVGHANLTITNIGAIRDSVRAQTNQLTVGDHSGIDVLGSTNVVNVGNSSNVGASGYQNLLNVVGNYATVTIGSGSTITSSGIHGTFNLNGATDVCQAGSNNTVYLNGGSASVKAGTDTSVWFRSFSNVMVAGDRTTAWLYNAVNRLTSGNNSAVQDNGNNDITNVGNNSNVLVNGNDDMAGAGNNSTVQVNGGINKVDVGDNSTVKVNAILSTVNAGNASTVSVTNSRDIVSVGNKGMVFLYSSGETVSIRKIAGTETISGFNFANTDKLDLTQFLGGISLKHDLSDLGKYVSSVGSGPDTILSIHGNAGLNTVVLRGSGSYGLSDFVAHNAFILPPH